MPIGLIVFFIGLAVWLAISVRAVRRNEYGAFFAWGLGLLLFLNLRYFIEGASSGIAFFIGIYDVLDNVGLVAGEVPGGMATCPDNACTVWGETYQTHTTWAVAFHERFLNGPQFRRNLLYSHIGFNTLAFLLMHVQLIRTGVGRHRAFHRIVGRVGFAAVTLSVFSACWLASQHGAVPEYGSVLSTYGFYFMSACVYVPVVLSVVTIRRGDLGGHRKWVIRYAGAMWGSFWLFRVMLFVRDPLFRDYNTVAIQLCIWLSAPLGIVIAEAFRRRAEAPSATVSEPVLA